MARPSSRATYAEYLALEAKAETKHARAGGTPEHARLQMNIGSALLAALRGRPCAVFSSDLRVRIEATDRATYPDVTVVCGPLQTSPSDKNAVTNPTLIVEVTSESTEADDRGEKSRSGGGTSARAGSSRMKRGRRGACSSRRSMCG